MRQRSFAPAPCGASPDVASQCRDEPQIGASAAKGKRVSRRLAKLGGAFQQAVLTQAVAQLVVTKAQGLGTAPLVEAVPD
jgi:hypothetical protein